MVYFNKYKEYVFNCPKYLLPFLPRATPQLKVCLWSGTMRSWERKVRLLSNTTAHRGQGRLGEETMVLTYSNAKTHQHRQGARHGTSPRPWWIGPHPTQSIAAATLLESPLVSKRSDSLWHFPGEREKVAEKRENPFQHLPHCSPQEWGTGRRYRMLFSQSMRQEHPPTSSSSSEDFPVFAVYGHSSWQCFSDNWRSRTCIEPKAHVVKPAAFGLLLLTGSLPENTHLLQPVWGSREAGSASVFYVEQLLK